MIDEERRETVRKTLHEDGPPMVEINYYDVLGVPKSATDGEIKKAFRKLAMKVLFSPKPFCSVVHGQNLNPSLPFRPSGTLTRTRILWKMLPRSFRKLAKRTMY